MVTARYKLGFAYVLSPLARWLSRAGVPPSAITLMGLALIFGSCVFVIRTGRVLAFCGLVAASGLFDVLDGAVARMSGRVTKFGAYLDAVCDRYAEAAVVVSVAIVTGYWIVSTVVLVGAFMTSYAKARAAMETPISNTEWPDLLERGERCLIYGVGLAGSQLIPCRPGGRDLYWWTLVLLAWLTHVTVVQRVLRARRFIRTRKA